MCQHTFIPYCAFWIEMLWWWFNVPYMLIYNFIDLASIPRKYICTLYMLASKFNRQMKKDTFIFNSLASSPAPSHTWIMWQIIFNTIQNKIRVRPKNLGRYSIPVSQSVSHSHRQPAICSINVYAPMHCSLIKSCVVLCICSDLFIIISLTYILPKYI